MQPLALCPTRRREADRALGNLVGTTEDVIRLRAAVPEDAPAIAAIYAPFVRDTTISFETDSPDAKEIARRMVSSPLYPWIVAVDESDEILGYCYATSFRARHSYRFSVETTVYVKPSAHRRSVGRRLYELLLATLERQGFTQAIAGIAVPNEPSVGFHEALGFVQAGLYRQVGYKLGGWRDVGVWQRPLAEPRDPPGEPKPFDPQLLR